MAPERDIGIRVEGREVDTMPPFILEQLRRQGLLEGDELAEVWEPILRDRVIGELLVTRHGVVAGRDGDRIYLRRIEKIPPEAEPYVGPRAATVLCNHEGIGLPGCSTCDPRARTGATATVGT